VAGTECKSIPKVYLHKLQKYTGTEYEDSNSNVHDKGCGKFLYYLLTLEKSFLRRTAVNKVVTTGAADSDQL
jgi:hypothetical protein